MTILLTVAVDPSERDVEHDPACYARWLDRILEGVPHWPTRYRVDVQEVER
jgi:hypothetical protein